METTGPIETTEGLAGAENAPPARPWISRITQVQLAELLLLVVAALYARSVTGWFLWDDGRLLFLKSGDALPAGTTFFTQLRGIWTGHQVDFFPVTSTLLLIESRLFHLNVIGYHVVTVALHASAAILLWRALERLEVRGAWLGALLFAIHPVCVESVAWIAETKNTLCLTLYAGALLAFLRFEERPARREYFLALGLFVLSLLAKTASVMLPFVLLLCAWWKRDRITRQDIVRSAPFFAASLVLGLVTIHMTNATMSTTGFEPAVTLAGRAFNAGRFVTFYLSKALVPQGLMTLYPRLPAAGILPDLALAAALAGFWVWRGYQSARAAFFAAAYFVLSLAPALGFFNMAFQVYADVADRFQYFGLIGITALAGAAIASLPQVVPLGAVLAAALAWSTFGLERPYHNEEMLWKHQIELDPNSVPAYEQLGNLRMQENRFADAYPVLEQAVFIDPNNWYARFDLGQLFIHVNRPVDALAEFQAAQRLQPRWPAATEFVGRADAALGKYDEAAVEFRAAMRMQPQSGTIHRDLGLVLARQGHTQEAANEFREALRLDSTLGGAREELDKLLKLLPMEQGGQSGPANQ